MRKFIVTLILLVIIAGTVFTFGYLPFFLDEGEYGIVHTKTNGWNHPVVRHGEFAWFWQALIPTNLTLHRIPLEERVVDLDETGTLPSGDVYARYTEGGEDFNYHVSGSISYQLSFSGLPELFAASAAAESDAADDDAAITRGLYDEVERKIRAESSAAVASLIEAEDPGLTPDELVESLRRRLEEQLPGLASVEIIVDDYRFPDMELYRDSRRQYLEFSEQAHRINLESLAEASSARAQEMSRIEILREYGALLEEYPVLLEYYSSRGGDLTLIPLPSTP